MPNTRVVVNRKAVDVYLKGGGGVAEDLARRANAIRTAADTGSGRGGDHTVDSAVGRRRIRFAVYTETFNAMWREARQRTLARALGAGR